MDAEHAVDLLVVQRMDVLVDGVTGQLHLIRSSIRKAINLPLLKKFLDC